MPPQSLWLYVSHLISLPGDTACHEDVSFPALTVIVDSDHLLFIVGFTYSI